MKSVCISSIVLPGYVEAVAARTGDICSIWQGLEGEGGDGVGTSTTYKFGLCRPYSPPLPLSN